jgi:hypothetical protein
LLFAFDGARTGDDDKFVAADFRAVDLDARLLLAKFPADEFVGRRDADYFFDLRHGFDGFETWRDIADANDADDDTLFTFDGVNFVAEVGHDPANLVDFLARCVQLHGNNHVLFLLPSPDERTQNKKAHSSRVGRISVNSTCLDDGPSLPVGAIRKSPPIRVGVEVHEKQCSALG